MYTHVLLQWYVCTLKLAFVSCISSCNLLLWCTERHNRRWKVPTRVLSKVARKYTVQYSIVGPHTCTCTCTICTCMCMSTCTCTYNVYVLYIHVCAYHAPAHAHYKAEDKSRKRETMEARFSYIHVYMYMFIMLLYSPLLCLSCRAFL